MFFEFGCDVLFIQVKQHRTVNDDDQYPPGWGIPQWKLTSPLPAQVVAVINAGERYF